jgi:hypothetical protein
MKWGRFRLLYILAFTAFALTGVVAHGLYHLSMEGYIPQDIYLFLLPALGPTESGRTIHVIIEVAAVLALLMAISEYAYLLRTKVPRLRLLKASYKLNANSDGGGLSEEDDWL